MDAETRRKLAIHEGCHFALGILHGEKPIGATLSPGRSTAMCVFERSSSGDRITDPAKIFHHAVMLAGGEVGEEMLSGRIIEGADRDGENSDRTRVDECARVLVNHWGRDQTFWRDAAYRRAASLIKEHLPLVLAVVAELQRWTVIGPEHWTVAALEAKAAPRSS